MDDLLAGLPAGAAPWLLGAALAGGLARGFSGFGTALIFVPIAAIAFGPQRAAPLMLALDAFAIAALTPAAWKVADRREAGLLAAGVVVGTPLGVLILLAAEPTAMRWGMAALIAAVLALLISGWRFRSKPTAPVSIGVGLVGGVMSGVALIGGPPVMAYLLGQDADAARIRAAFALYLCATGIVAAIAFGAAGLLGAWLVGPLLLTLPVYGVGIWAGTRMFHMASALTFRRICYAMIAVAALLSLPALDGLLR